MQTIAPRSVLVVDAEPRVANTLRMLLMYHRHRVEVAQRWESEPGLNSFS